VKKLLRVVLSMAALVGGASIVRAEGWSLNPFSKSTTTTTQVMNGRPLNYGRQEPTTWDKTKQFFSKTADAITPDWGSKAKKPTTKKKPKKSWWAASEPEKPRTVSEWLGQDRLDP
jgi:hypothetical protein